MYTRIDAAHLLVLVVESPQLLRVGLLLLGSLFCFSTRGKTHKHTLRS